MGWLTRIDKLTGNLIEVASGELFDTEIYELKKSELQQITIASGWHFDWREEFTGYKRVYKLVLSGSEEIQGLISIENKGDHLFLPLIESAPHNFGKQKKYARVAESLTAFACKQSFLHGHEGAVSFIAKTKLIHHYESSLEAIHIGNQRMIIIEENAKISPYEPP